MRTRKCRPLEPNRLRSPAKMCSGRYPASRPSAEIDTFSVGHELVMARRAANNHILIFVPGEMFPEFIDSNHHYSFSKSVFAAIETRSSR